LARFVADWWRAERLFMSISFGAQDVAEFGEAMTVRPASPSVPAGCATDPRCRSEHPLEAEFALAVCVDEQGRAS
jgi:hypothetical protein